MSNLIRNTEQLEDGIDLFCFPDVSEPAQSRRRIDLAETIPALFSHTSSSQFTITAYQFRDLHDHVGQSQKKPDGETSVNHSSRAHERTPRADLQQTLDNERNQILHQAQMEAERYLTQARDQAASIENEARAVGYHEGENRAREEITAQFAHLLTSLQQAVEQVTHLHEERLRAAETDIVELAFQLARKIVRHDIRCNPQVVIPALRQALAGLSAQDDVVVHVNPADLEQMTALQCELHNLNMAKTTLILKGDEAIERGGCLVHSSFGTIDMQIETQFEELGHQFNERRQSER